MQLDSLKKASKMSILVNHLNNQTLSWAAASFPKPAMLAAALVVMKDISPVWRRRQNMGNVEVNARLWFYSYWLVYYPGPPLSPSMVKIELQLATSLQHQMIPKAADVLLLALEKYHHRPGSPAS